MSIGMRAKVVCSSGTTRDGLAVLPLDGPFELVALVVAGTRDRIGEFVGHCPYRFGERLDRSPRRSLD